jgi:hypothetical protein
MTDVKVACDLLRQAGGDMDASATLLSDAATSAKTLNMTEAEMSYWGRTHGLVDAYAEIQNLMVTMLTDGHQAVGDVGTAVIGVANTYETADQETANSFPGGHK